MSKQKQKKTFMDETMATRLCLYFVDQRQLAVEIQTPIFEGQGSQMLVIGLGVVEDRQLLLHKRLISTNIDNLPNMLSSGSFKCLKRL